MTLDGRIVEYLENGKFICAFVFEDKGNRLRLLNQNSRELNLPPNRLIHWTNQKVSPAPPREDIVSLLQKKANKRTSLAEGISLEEIWETVSEKDEDAFGLDFMASLFWGDGPTDDQSAAFFSQVYGCLELIKGVQWNCFHPGILSMVNEPQGPTPWQKPATLYEPSRLPLVIGRFDVVEISKFWDGDIISRDRSDWNSSIIHRNHHR